MLVPEKAREGCHDRGANETTMTLEIQINQLNTASAVLIRHLRLQVPSGCEFHGRATKPCGGARPLAQRCALRRGLDRASADCLRGAHVRV